MALLPAYKVRNEDDEHQPSERCANDDGNKHLVLVQLTLLRWTQKRQFQWFDAHLASHQIWRLKVNAWKVNIKGSLYLQQTGWC